MKGNTEVVNVLNQLLAGELMQQTNTYYTVKCMLTWVCRNLPTTRYTNQNMSGNMLEI